MFRADPVVAAAAGLCVPELAALSLSNRIPADDDIAAKNKSLAKNLIMSLPVLRVSGRHENCRMLRHWSAARIAVVTIGYVHQCRHVDTRETLKDQLVDVKAIHRDRSCHSGVQWSSTRWQLAHHAQDFLAHFLLQAQKIVFRTDAVPHLLTLRHLRAKPVRSDTEDKG